MNFRESKIETITIILASMTTIISLILSFNYPKLQILILTILTILLPVIYQIGHIFSKESIKYKNEQDYIILENIIEELEEENRYLKNKETHNPPYYSSS
jgi:hypothetical protein